MKMVILEFSLAFIENAIIFLFSDNLLHKRFKLKTTWTFAALICTIISFLFANYIFYIKSLFSIIFLLIAFCILYNDSIFIKLGIVATSLYLLYISDIVIGNILTIVMNKQLYEVFYSSFINRVIICLFIKLFNAILFFIVYKMFSHVEIGRYKKEWVLYDIIVGVFMAVSIMFIYLYSFAKIEFLTSISFIVISTVFFIMSIIVIYFFTEICNSFQQKRRMYEIQASYDSMRNIVIMQNQTNIQLHKIRHDMKNHIITVNQLFNTGNIEEAHKLLLQTSDYVDSINFNLKSQTGNSLIDAKISSIAAQCENDGIDFKYVLETLPELKVELLDLSALLSNLFDNAIKATKNAENRQISIKIFSYKQYIYFNMLNSFSGEILSEERRLLSTKPEKQEHGYGTQIINDICEKYNGIFTWKIEGKQFSSNVIILNE